MKYGIVVADPPWAFSDKLTMSDVKRGAEANYSTLTMADIRNLPVQDLCAPDALLALWVPSSLLEDGLGVMKAWGFVQKQIYTWVKTTKSGGLAFGMGRQFRGTSEHALIGTCGRPKPASKSERNVELSLNMGHSIKPASLQERLEAMYPDASKLEMFARRERPGWDCVGNECPTTAGIDIRSWFEKAIA